MSYLNIAQKQMYILIIPWILKHPNYLRGNSNYTTRQLFKKKSFERESHEFEVCRVKAFWIEENLEKRRGRKNRHFRSVGVRSGHLCVGEDRFG